MDIQKFEAGDIVRLRSGGRNMTVKGYAPQINIPNGPSESQTIVICYYRKSSGKIVKKRIHQDELVLVNI